MQIKRKSTFKGSPSSPSATERGRKRHHREPSTDKINMEDDGFSDVDCHMDMPKLLKDILIEDYENITKDDQLVVLPAKVTVTDILNRYLQEYEKVNGNDEMLEQTIQGLKLYFNHTLGTMLLYRSERNQYQQFESYGKEWVDIYGGEHLLRLFVELPMMISQTNVDIETMEILKSTFMDILIFLQDNEKELIVKDYQVNR
ncbi:MRG domain-containing protein [Chlamydoabsidia padenii]|nr:MRG domain-containing protein [Chlamydoabsidia padenii]